MSPKRLHVLGMHVTVTWRAAQVYTRGASTHTADLYIASSRLQPHNVPHASIKLVLHTTTQEINPDHDPDGDGHLYPDGTPGIDVDLHLDPLDHDPQRSQGRSRPRHVRTRLPRSRPRSLSSAFTSVSSRMLRPTSADASVEIPYMPPMIQNPTVKRIADAMVSSWRDMRPMAVSLADASS